MERNLNLGSQYYGTGGMIMDEKQIEEIIQRIQNELQVHDEKFAGEEAHQNCKERFVKVIADLKAQASKVSAKK